MTAKSVGLVSFALAAILAEPGCSSRTVIAFALPSDGAVPADIALPPVDVTGGADSMVPSEATAPPADAMGGLIPPDLRPDADTTAGSDAASGPRILFSDRFDDGFAAKWSTSDPSDGPITDATDGTNKIATLDSTQTDSSRLRCNFDGSYFTEMNISASMKVRIDQAPTSTRTVRLDVRQDSNTVNIFYAVGVTVGSGDGTISKASIIKKVPDGSGNYTECELAAGPALSPPIPMGEWHTIQITISGTTSAKLSAYLDGALAATFTDDCTSQLMATNGVRVPNPGCLAGQTGLGIQVEKGIKASVDDVLVTTP